MIDFRMGKNEILAYCVKYLIVWSELMSQKSSFRTNQYHAALNYKRLSGITHFSLYINLDKQDAQFCNWLIIWTQ